MNKDVLSFVTEKTRELIDAPTVSSETKAAAQSWLEAAGTDREKEETKKYIDELEEDIMPIDNLIGFASSDQGKAYLAKRKLRGSPLMHAKSKLPAVNTVTATACLCVAAILEKKDDMLK